MQIRRKSNQRITKVKLDKILSLLNKAEKMTPEEGTTIVSTTDELTPYPTLGNLRFWIRDYLLKGLSGIKIKEFKATQSLTVKRLKTGEAFYNVMIDGLILKSNLYKHISYNDNDLVLNDVQVPKPGLQLSNLMKWIEAEYQSTEDPTYVGNRIKYKWFRRFSDNSQEKQTNQLQNSYFIALKGDSVDTLFTTMFLWEQQLFGYQCMSYFWGWQPNSSYWFESPFDFEKHYTDTQDFPEMNDTSRAAWKWIYNNKNKSFKTFFITPYFKTSEITVYDETGTNSTSYLPASYYAIGNAVPEYQKLYSYNTTYFTSCYKTFSLNRNGISKEVSGVLVPTRMNS